MLAVSFMSLTVSLPSGIRAFWAKGNFACIVSGYGKSYGTNNVCVCVCVYDPTPMTYTSIFQITDDTKYIYWKKAKLKKTCIFMSDKAFALPSIVFIHQNGICIFQSGWLHHIFKCLWLAGDFPCTFSKFTKCLNWSFIPYKVYLSIVQDGPVLELDIYCTIYKLHNGYNL